jgi:hypothetical protein
VVIGDLLKLNDVRLALGGIRGASVSGRRAHGLGYFRRRVCFSSAAHRPPLTSGGHLHIHVV